MNSGLSYLSPSRADVLDRRPPVVLAAGSQSSHARAARTIEAAGYRVAAVDLDQAADRLTQQGAASALWIELDEDRGVELDRLVDRANAEAATGRYPAIVAAPMVLLDALAARLDAPHSQILIDADEPTRAAALAIATAWHGNEARLGDITAEPSSARLRQLSDEVGRIAATLARLSSGAGPTGPAATERPASGAAADLPPVTSEQVRNIIRGRRLRARFFDAEMFADPAWDMLLDLLAAEIQQHRVPVSSLCIAAAVPATTALRWIKTMTDAQLFVRRADPHDGRRIFVELSPRASQALHGYFAELSNPLVV